MRPSIAIRCAILGAVALICAGAAALCYLMSRLHVPLPLMIGPKI